MPLLHSTGLADEPERAVPPGYQWLEPFKLNLRPSPTSMSLSYSVLYQIMQATQLDARTEAKGDVQSSLIAITAFVHE
ncbi:hypothetical protein NUW54_g272 [Trametes sanguinea]|uniref:Uncharacterized protein n=1 Tax=Trametes sanguinea TaxID=158606 RepID=A0ACC1QCF4_9APHY|nr:hypothetical protein NUW54_g272 [Trametes sanguinea]